MISISDIYKTYFNVNGSIKPEWKGLNSSEKALKSPLSKLPVDFSIHTPLSWKDTAKSTFRRGFQILALCSAVYTLGKYAPKRLGLDLFYKASPALVKRLAESYFVKLALLPWGAYRLSQYLAQRLIMTCLYPAQSRLVRNVFPQLLNLNPDKPIQDALKLQTQGFLVRRVRLERNGDSYSAILISHPDKADNGKWVLQATGNCELIENSFSDFAAIYRDYDFNILVLNGPGVLENGGQATPYKMGEAQETATQYLETALHAKKIILAGRSLGAAAMAQAILQHEFKKDVTYTVISQMTFHRSSTICARIGSFSLLFLETLLIPFIKWAGCEMDALEACEKLRKHSITHVVIQGAKPNDPLTVNDFLADEIIEADMGLGYALTKKGTAENEILCPLNRSHIQKNELLHTSNQAIKQPLALLREKELI